MPQHGCSVALNIDDHLLADSEQRVLCALYGKLTGDRVTDTATQKVTSVVRPVSRLGQSGARVYDVRFGSGTLFVMKLDSGREIRDENERMCGLRTFFPECHSSVYHNSGHLGGILYRNVRGRDPAETGKGCELEEAIVWPLEKEEDRRSPWRDDRAVERAIREVYREAMRTCHRTISYEGQHILYDWYSEGAKLKYFRRDESKARIQSALGRTAADTEWFNLDGKRLLNPVWAADRFFRQPTTVAWAPVHGDLHGRNVILDKHTMPHLIDFAWAEREGHALVDFTLLENSLRFFLMPKCTHLDDRLRIDATLLEEDGAESLLRFTNWRSGPREVRYVKRMCKILAAMRQQARHVLDNAAQRSGCRYHFAEYLASQFVLLYGVLKFPNCDFRNGLRVLGMVAKELRGSQFAA